MNLHPTLTAILEQDDPMTSKALADCLVIDSRAVCKAIQTGKIEGTHINLKGEDKIHRYRITKAAAIHWLWKSTKGDKTLLRAAIEAECPAMLPFLTGDAVRDEAAEAEALSRSRKSRKPARGPNIIPFDPKCDLFPQVKPATQVA